MRTVGILKNGKVAQSTEQKPARKPAKKPAQKPKQAEAPAGPIEQAEGE